MLAFVAELEAAVVVENEVVAENEVDDVEVMVPTVSDPMVAFDAVSVPWMTDVEAVSVFTFAVFVAVREPICDVPTISLAAVSEVVEVNDPTV